MPGTSPSLDHKVNIKKKNLFRATDLDTPTSTGRVMQGVACQNILGALYLTSTEKIFFKT
jgi:hypothetical protein